MVTAHVIAGLQALTLTPRSLQTGSWVFSRNCSRLVSLHCSWMQLLKKKKKSEEKKKIFHLDPFKKRNLFYSLVPFLCHLNFTAAGSIIHSHVPASLVFPMWKSLETDSPKFQIKQCQIFRRTMRTLLQDLAEKSLKGLGTKAWTNWEDRSANSLANQVSNHSIFLCAGCLSLRSSHLMGAILHHFKGFRSASELQADAPIADIFMTEHARWYVFQPLSSLILGILSTP